MDEQDDGVEHAVLVPFLDMVNHEPHALGYHTFTSETGRFEIRALGGAISPGQEAMITYGMRTNAKSVRPPVPPVR